MLYRVFRGMIGFLCAMVGRTRRDERSMVNLSVFFSGGEFEFFSACQFLARKSSKNVPKFTQTPNALL